MTWNPPVRKSEEGRYVASTTQGMCLMEVTDGWIAATEIANIAEGPQTESKTVLFNGKKTSSRDDSEKDNETSRPYFWIWRQQIRPRISTILNERMTHTQKENRCSLKNLTKQFVRPRHIGSVLESKKSHTWRYLHRSCGCPKSACASVHSEDGKAPCTPWRAHHTRCPDGTPSRQRKSDNPSTTACRRTSSTCCHPSNWQWKARECSPRQNPSCTRLWSSCSSSCSRPRRTVPVSGPAVSQSILRHVPDLRWREEEEDATKCGYVSCQMNDEDKACRRLQRRLRASMPTRHRLLMGPTEKLWKKGKRTLVFFFFADARKNLRLVHDKTRRTQNRKTDPW